MRLSTLSILVVALGVGILPPAAGAAPAAMTVAEGRSAGFQHETLVRLTERFAAQGVEMRLGDNKKACCRLVVPVLRYIPVTERKAMGQELVNLVQRELCSSCVAPHPTIHVYLDPAERELVL